MWYEPITSHHAEITKPTVKQECGSIMTCGSVSSSETGAQGAHGWMTAKGKLSSLKGKH